MSNQKYALEFADIKRIVKIEMMLEREGSLATLWRSGENLVGPCPIHGGGNAKSRQFQVDTNKQLFRCFSPKCEAGGDVITLVSNLYSCTDLQAARHLQQWFAFAPATKSPRRRPVSDNQPAYIAFAVSNREYDYTDKKTGEVRKANSKTRIGAAWPLKNGGLSLTLDALPVPTTYKGEAQTRIVLWPFEAAEVEEEEKPAPAPAPRKR